MKKILASLAAISLVAGAGALAHDHDKKGDKKDYKKQDIVATAVGADALSTLVAAVTAGELVETLQGDGPFTVFAPTNDAFAAIQSTVDTLLQPENKESLQRVLTAHVVAANLTAGDLVVLANSNGGSISIDTVAGDTLVVSVTDAGVTVTDENGGVASVVAADVKAKNGVVHVVDAVLVPDTN